MTNDQAKEYTKQLLKHYPFVYCPTLAGKTSNRTPHKGDIVLFYNSGTYTHTGYVYAVDSSKFYTVEGNTSGASGIVANGGGTCKKFYATASYSSSKFYRPDYSILVNAKVFSSTDEAINAIINVAMEEVGYLEKKSNANLYDKTANAGYNNYTKYWKEISVGLQAQPWCACFVTWIIQTAIKNGKSSSGVESSVEISPSTSNSSNTSNTCKTSYDNVKKVLSSYISSKKWTNGSYSKSVYADSAKKNKIGTLDPSDTAAVIGRKGAMFIVAYNVENSNEYKVGFVDYSGGVAITSNVVKVWKNGSTTEPVYSSTKKSVEIGSINKRESCSCLGSINGKKIVLYKVGGASFYKVGVVDYNGGL